MNPEISIFFESKEIALFGASATGKRFGNSILKQLVKRGFTVYPVHRTAETIDDVKTYRTIEELPPHIQSACLCMKPENVAGIIDRMIDSPIKNFWFQQGADFSSFKTKLEEAGKMVIIKKCVLMYAGEATGIHAVHKFFSKLFGRY